jgi:hypothetical protein
MVFTDDEVESLNAYQHSGAFHPFTCGSGNRTDAHHLDGEGLLVATNDGWHCPYCDYTQDWAHQFMKDGSWRIQHGATNSFWPAFVDGFTMEGLFGDSSLDEPTTMFKPEPPELNCGCICPACQAGRHDCGYEQCNLKAEKG